MSVLQALIPTSSSLSVVDLYGCSMIHQQLVMHTSTNCYRTKLTDQMSDSYQMPSTVNPVDKTVCCQSGSWMAVQVHQLATRAQTQAYMPHLYTVHVYEMYLAQVQVYTQFTQVTVIQHSIQSITYFFYYYEKTRLHWKVCKKKRRL